MRFRFDNDIIEIHEMMFQPCGMENKETGKYDMDIFVSLHRIPGGRWDDDINVIHVQVDIDGMGIDTFEAADEFCKKLSDEVLVKGYLDLNDGKWCGRDVDVY